MTRKSLLFNLLAFSLFAIPFVFTGSAMAQAGSNQQGLTATVVIDQTAVGFRIPNLADILTFVIRVFFVIAGLVALVYLLLGAFEWITSGGDEEAVGSARKKITAAIVGVILVVAVLAVIVTLEQVVFRRSICFGISCPATIPNLVQACRESLPPELRGSAECSAAADCDPGRTGGCE
ncbi:MAG: hypothetical protein N2691_04895 [Patescibacteria group bacterium]|nr:hypothetical protein [Patescibacteria group bacterium]